jgi:hypothetical protein
MTCFAPSAPISPSNGHGKLIHSIEQVFSANDAIKLLRGQPQSS